MRVFVTGATGFIGSIVVEDLIRAGHQVLGLSRSDAGAQFLTEAGAEVHRGDIYDVESLRSGAAKTDGVIHCAFNHDAMANFVANCETDRKVIEALGAELAGSKRHLVITSGTGRSASGQPRTEEDPLIPSSVFPRGASEEAAESVLAKGVSVSVIRLPQVHDPFKQGLITPLIAVARQKGVSAYVGDGTNRWPAAHRLDAAALYRLALEKAVAGARYNAVGEEGISLREIAESIGRGLKITVVSLSPEKVGEHFGWLSMMVGIDMPASSVLTQQRLGWRPSHAGLIADLDLAMF
jgi:nucleoside-diphosphate-sugar epimerase